MRTGRSAEFGIICEERVYEFKEGFGGALKPASRGIRLSDSDGRLRCAVP